MKRIVAGLLAVAIVFGSGTVLPAENLRNSAVITVSAEDEDIFVYGDFQCKKRYDEIEIVKYLAHDVSIVIPDNIDGLPVVGIGEGAFADTIVTQEVEFPDTLRYIGESAFANNWTLREVILPDSVNSIGKYAFEYCTALKILKMPDNEYMDIGIYAFQGCSNIKEITWEGYSYKDNFGDSIETLLRVDSLPKDCLIRCKYDGKAHKYAKENGYSYEITNVFDNFACEKYEKKEWDNENEEYIVVDEGYEIYDYLGNEANVTVPAKINNKNVYSVSKLNDTVKNVTLSNGIIYIGNLGSSVESINVPISLSEINCNISSVKKITFDDGITNISDFCSGLDNLETVILPNSVTKIDSNAFDSCTNLKNITIPNKVKEIGSYAFRKCDNLRKINIPASVEKIGFIEAIDDYEPESLFLFSNNMEEVSVDADNKYYSSENGLLYNKDKTILYYCPAVKTNVVISDKVKTIDGGFENCRKIEKIIIPEGVETLSDEAILFNMPTQPPLKSITIPKSIKSIGTKAIGYYVNYPYFYKINDFKIYCYSNTAGEQYAKDNGFEYELLDKPVVNGTGTVNIKNTVNGLKVDNLSVDIGKEGSGKTDKSVKIASDGKFTVEGLTDGNYDFTFKADKCVPRTYSVTVKNGLFQLDNVELHLCGDTNGDGKITTADIGRINADIRKTKAISDKYDFAVSDTNGDGKLTTADIGKINAHIRGTKNLW